MSLFGKKPTPEEYVKKWKRELKKEERNLERTIRGIEVEEAKLKKSIKDLAKKGDKTNAKVLAKELVHSRKAKERLYNSKAQLNSVSMQLSQNLAMMKMASTMQRSTQVMAMMNNLVKLPQLNQIMMGMAREMEKAGLIEEIMDDVLDNDDEIEEAADEELEKVIDEITMPLKATSVPARGIAIEENDNAKDEDLTDLQARLGALKG